MPATSIFVTVFTATACSGVDPSHEHVAAHNLCTGENVCYPAEHDPARDLGHKLEGLDSEALEITKYKGKFPYMNYLDEVGAYYTERIAVQATQVRSLEFALVMMSQDRERIENQTSAANVATLMQNAGTKVAGKIVSDDKTARTISNAAGQEARANMVSLQRQDGLIGTSGSMVTTSISRWRTKSMQDLIKLQPGENYTVFQGDPVPRSIFLHRTSG